jgi:hypothetical protein
MAETPPLERLTASDLFMLLWDDYGWPNQIGGLAILDGTSLLDRDGHLRIEAVRQRLEARLQLVPRLRQLLYRPRLGLGWPLWVDAPCFDLADHLRVPPWPRPPTTPSCCRPASNWPGDRWTGPGRCGSCGCCPAYPTTNWACS